MNNLEKLDNILLSDNVVEEFNTEYLNPQFKTWLLEILPEIEDCLNLKQDHPWHIYNCLNHLLHSVKNINSQTKHLPYNIRRMLSYVMFLHDIGKPAVAYYHYSKKYGRKVESFTNHNIKSTEIASRVLHNFNFNNSEIKIIKQLIFKHDIFMFIKLVDTHNKFHKLLSKKVLEDEIADLNKVGNGKELLGYLIMVGRADSLSQNLDLSSETLKLHDKMEEMLNNI